MTPAEKVLAWLGSTGMSVRILGSEPIQVAANDASGDRVAQISVVTDGSPSFFTRTYTRPVGRNGFSSGPLEESTWNVHGEAGVRYLAHWLRYGGSVKSPYVVYRKGS